MKLKINESISCGRCLLQIWLLQVLLAALGATTLSTAASHHLHQSYWAHQARCPSEAPPQWRPYLDAASKAHLAPFVVVGTLQQLNLLPMQVVSSQPAVQASTSSHNQLRDHAQSINNAGLTIEATFSIHKVLKRSSPAEPPVNKTLKIYYKISPSLSTMNELAKLETSSQSPSEPFADLPLVAVVSNKLRGSQKYHQHTACALELSEHELTKKVNMFKLHQAYLLFLDAQQLHQVSHAAQLGSNNQRHVNRLHVGANNLQQASNYDAIFYPFASHEPANNKTSRAMLKILCKGCGTEPLEQTTNATNTAQAPQVHLLNSTFVSVSQWPTTGTKRPQNWTQLEPPPELPSNSHRASFGRTSIKLDCQVTGYPTPWVEWFRNGKLLRNRPGRQTVRTSRLRNGRPAARLSRLELELRPGRNETGLYECRAMNVAAREPAVATYTLLVLPARLALFPLDPPVTTTTTTAASFSTSTSTTATPRPSEGPAQQTASLPTAPPASATAPKPTSRLDETSAATSSTPAASTTQPETQPAREKTIEANDSGGQACPELARDNFCMNKGTCTLIGQIEEYFCRCAEGYHGHRCEYKSMHHR